MMTQQQAHQEPNIRIAKPKMLEFPATQDDLRRQMYKRIAEGQAIEMVEDKARQMRNGR